MAGPDTVSHVRGLCWSKCGAHGGHSGATCSMGAATWALMTEVGVDPRERRGPHSPAALRHPGPRATEQARRSVGRRDPHAFDRETMALGPNYPTPRTKGKREAGLDAGGQQLGGTRLRTLRRRRS